MKNIKTKYCVIFLVFIIFLAACSSKEKDISFSQDIQPILNENCINCHNDNSQMGDLNLSSFEKMKDSKLFGKQSKLFLPGKPMESLLYTLVISKNETFRMPPANYGYDELSSTEKQYIKIWILEGAKNN